MSAQWISIARLFTGSVVVLFFAGMSSAARGQQPHTCSLGAVTRVDPLPNGVRLHAGQVLEEITALGPKVLRIRIAPTGVLPEDASWAVLPAARHASTPVEALSSGATVGFRTQALQVAVRRDDLALTVRDAQGEVIQQDAQPVCFTGKAFAITKRMPDDEHYFGLGDKTGPLDRRGQAFTLWNTDSYRFQESTDPLYKSIPYFMTFRAGIAAGVLLDDTWRTNFDFGRDEPGVYSFGAVDGPLDYYLFLGPSPRQVVEAYAWLTGKPPLPPRWGLGFQQSRYSYVPASRLMEVARRLRADRIPADAVYLDIDFQDRNRPFTVDRQLFPDFDGTVKALHQLNLHLVTITDLHIAKAPQQGYLPYDSGIAGDEFVHNPDGSVFAGVVWPGMSVFPDFTRAASRVWWGNLYREFVADGVDGFWNDMNEPSVFNTPEKTIPSEVLDRIEEPGFAPRTATQAEIHNVFGMENSRATYEGLLRLRPGQRPFVLTRATYAGGQRYAVTWTGDDSSTWNHLRMVTPMLENLGLSGFAFAGADVGGFAGTPSAELLTRWLQVAAFEPIDRDHSEKGTGGHEPWVGGPAQEDIRRRFIEARYRLMPYLYTAAEESSRTGIPIMRPIFLDYPDAATDHHPIDIDPGAGGEFLLGHDLLIADSPYPEEPDAYMVEFPTAVWYDYWTGERIEGNPVPPPAPELAGLAMPPTPVSLVPLRLNVRPTLDTLPVFVRGGAIVPVAPLTQSTMETPQGPLTLRVYAGPDCRGDLYLDDGESFAYTHGDDLRMSFACEITAAGMRVSISPHQGSYPAWWKSIALEVYGWTGQQGIARYAAGSSGTALVRRGNAETVTVPDNGKGLVIDLRGCPCPTKSRSCPCPY
jgi:alpha-glucosidase